MTSKEALENIKNAVEYLTRIDYVDPIVRGEVKQILFDAYHETTPEFKIIEKDLELLEIIRKNMMILPYHNKNKEYESIALCMTFVGEDVEKIKELLK